MCNNDLRLQFHKELRSLRLKNGRVGLPMGLLLHSYALGI
jgi:hypothetical protein